MNPNGTFYGVGVGPGDPELMTLKAARILAEVDFIFLPATAAHMDGFAGKIIESLRLDPRKFRPVALCMSRQRAEDEDAYERAAAEIVRELRAGKSVAWIAEGDPLFYSTFLHVWSALCQLDPEARVEIVPGVTSLQAAAAVAQIPIARLDESVAIVPAAYGLDHLSSLVHEFACIGLLKVNSVFDQLLDQLAAIARPLDVVFVEKVGTSEQRVVRDVESLRGQKLPYMSLVLLRRANDTSSTRKRGSVSVIGVGPGHRDLLTPQARSALRHAEVVVGYSGYFPWIEPLLHGKERIAMPLGQERERAAIAIERAQQGRLVAVISSGDPGIYAMASVVLETIAAVDPQQQPEVVVVPGVSALNAAAALLGAPLGHDFAVISLSDLLTPWEIIEKRLSAAVEADYVIALFNPKSQRRDWQLERTRTILLRHRAGATPVGIVHNASRPGQTVCLTTLQDMDCAAVDMFALVIVGNSTTRVQDGRMLTPRGYEIMAAEQTP